MDLSKIIESEEFKNSIKQAVKNGIYEDWGYDGTFDAFDEDCATDSVIEVIKKKLL